MRKRILLLIGAMALALTAKATEYNAPNATYDGVNNCYNNTSNCSPAGPNAVIQDGDVLKIPSGTQNWDRSINVLKAIEIIGAGAQAGGTNITGTVSGKPPFVVTVAPGKNFRISSMKLGGVADNKILVQGVNYGDPTHWARFDHIWFTSAAGYSMRWLGGTIGVVDHCFFPDVGINGSETVFVKQAAYGANEFPGANFGDGSYASDDSFATLANVFFEDCVYGHVFDSQAGGRYVVRHCTADPAGEGQSNHGSLDSTGGERGCMAMDVYNNIYIRHTAPGMIVFRGGSGRVFNNYGTGPYSNGLHCYQYRQGNPNPKFGGADGACVFDRNATGTITTPPGGSHTHAAVPGGTPGNGAGDIYLDVTLGADQPSPPSLGAGGDVTLHTGGTHQVDCWKYFVMSNETEVHDLPNVWFMGINGNTATDGSGNTTFHLQYAGNTVGGSVPIRFLLNDRIVIRKVDSYADGHGRGKGPMLTRTASGPGLPVGVTFNDEALWSIYFWNNKFRATRSDTTSGAASTYNTTALSTWPGTNGGSIACGPANSLAQVRVGREVINAAPTGASVGGDYNWNASSTGTAANWVGADDEVRDFLPAGDPAIGYDHRFQVTGSGGATYPHPAVSGTTPTATVGPAQSSATFAPAPVTVNCAATPPSDCFQFTTSNFTAGTIDWDVTAGALPPSVTLNNTTNRGRLSGVPTGGAANYNFTVRARNIAAGESATKSFTVFVTASNQAPTATLAAPANGAVYTAPATINLAATANDSDGTISSLTFYRGGSTVIGDGVFDATASQYKYTWTSVAAGSYTITAKATDNLSTQSAASNSAAITVSTPAPSPTPPAQITVQP